MANKFWVGGTGTWSSTNTTNWSTTSGGAGGAAVPNVSDIVTFDGSSGGGVVTVDSSINGAAIQQLVTSNFTGTLDFSVNNPSLTITVVWTDTGTAVHTISLGSGTFTFSGTSGNLLNITNTNLTLNAGTSTISFAPAFAATSSRNMVSTASQTFATISVSPTNQNGMPIAFGGTVKMATLTAPAGTSISGQNSATVVVNTSFAMNGNSTTQSALTGGAGSTTPTFNIPAGTALSWMYLAKVSFAITTGAINATNSFDGSGNNMNGGTITPPASGGGAHMTIG